MFKKMKFEKSKYDIIKKFFILMIFFIFVSILYTSKIFYSYSEVKNLFYPVEPVVFNFNMKSDYIKSNAFVCFDDECIVIDDKSNLFSKIFLVEYSKKQGNELNRRVKNITLNYPKSDNDFIDKLEDVYYFVGNKKYCLTKDEIIKKDKDEIKMIIREKDNEVVWDYVSLSLNIGNFRSFFNSFCMAFMSVFYNWKYFIVSIFWISALYIFYLYNREEIKFDKIKNFLNDKTYWILGLITLLGVVLRLDNLNYYPLWTDEVYTKTVAIKSFLSCFKDAGNPPLFFILEYIFTSVFKTSDVALRFLPFLFGSMFAPLIFLFFKNINKNLALLASFLAAINSVNIYHSTEARGYALCMMLVVLSIYFLFEYLKNPVAKNLIIYLIITALLINLNYLCAIFTFCNFIYALVDLIEKKNTKKIPFLVSGYSLSCLTFLPYLIISFKTAVSDGFNGWISPLTVDTFKYIIKAYFVNKYIFLSLCFAALLNLILIYLPKDLILKINLKINEKKADLLIYLTYTIALFLIIASAISLGIKPIIHKRVLLSLYSLLFLYEIVLIFGVFEFEIKTKLSKIFKYFYSLVFVLLMFVITSPMPVKETYRLDDFMYILSKETKKYSSDYTIHAITTDFDEYLDNYPEIRKLNNIKWHYVDTNSGNYIKKVSEVKKFGDNTKEIFYIHNIAANPIELKKDDDKISLFFTNSIQVAKIVNNINER